MTRQELETLLRDELTGLADKWPECPRPSGTFVGSAPKGLSGIRLVAPDGATFYLAVLEKADFESEPRFDPAQN